MSRIARNGRGQARAGAGAFTIIELMVVITLIAVLMAILMPTLVSAQRNARKVECQSNLRSIGQILIAYTNENNGWLFPVGPDRFDGQQVRPSTLGTNKPPNERWPMYASFKELKTSPNPPPWGTTPYVEEPYQPELFPALPYTPKVMRCREDSEAFEAHSYVLNKHLADKRIRYGSRNFGGLTSSEVVVMGEKVTTERDYYMERQDFGRVVEKYRHGLKWGSNYLYHDGHVGTVLPREALTGLDPWDLRVPERPLPRPDDQRPPTAD